MKTISKSIQNDNQEIVVYESIINYISEYELAYDTQLQVENPNEDYIKNLFNGEDAFGEADCAGL